MHVAVARASDGTTRVELANTARPTRLHIAVESDIDVLMLDVAMFESGAAVQLRDDDYLISVDWLLHQLAAAGVDDSAARNHLIATARGVDGYVVAVDAIRAGTC